jgi:single-strand DNA-binding protein
MASYNKVMLLGNLTRDPQLSYLPSQTAVVEISIATNRKFKKQDGSQGEEVCFTDCTMFGKRAEVINKYLHKGDPLFIEGRLKFDSWQDKDGKKRSKLRVLIENFEFLGGGKKQGGGGGDSSSQPPNAEPQGQDAAFGQDDDIPF